jgi:hypothetical protein
MAIVFTVTGHSALTTRVIGSGNQPSYVAWGTGAGTMSATANTLYGEANDRVQGTASPFTSACTNDTYQVVGILSATAAYAITNAGIFDGSTNGNMWVAGDFGTLNLASGDSVSFTVRLQVA